VYVPRRLAYLSELYRWLQDELEQRDSQRLIGGFSLYEVAGSYRGQSQTYTEQTLVVRLIFERAAEERERESHEIRVREILDEVVRITRRGEEEIWIIRMPADKLVWARVEVNHP